MLSENREEQERHGYIHTLREILQQPSTWLDSAERMIAKSPELLRRMEGVRSLVLTGSGSSEYAGACVRLVLQNALGFAAQTVGGGALLTHGARAVPPERPGLMVSLARSGDSPESVGAVSLMLDTEPLLRHLVITCNQQGQMAQICARHPGHCKSFCLDFIRLCRTDATGRQFIAGHWRQPRHFGHHAVKGGKISAFGA